MTANGQKSDRIGATSETDQAKAALRLRAQPVLAALGLAAAAAAAGLAGTELAGLLPPGHVPREAAPVAAALAAATSLAALVSSLRFNAHVPKIVGSVEKAAFDRAMRDPLTGLYNRAGFRMRLEAVLGERTGESLIGVLYIDLDRFKEVNDTFGHDMGDKLLMAVTKRVLEEIGDNSTLARLGGDEFAIILEGRKDVAEIEETGSRITRSLGKPFLIDKTELQIGGSVGVVVAPIDGEDSPTLVRRADIAMYQVKANGRGESLRFVASMEDELRRRRLLETELRHAVERNQLRVLYQPFMASDGETLVGVEALLRWEHPTEGMISPAVFIPIAEESGLIVEIGAWVMRQAMRDALDWPSLHLAVNVSPVQFRRPTLLEDVLAIVEETGFDRKRLEVEITEGVLMDDAEAAIAAIKGFRDAGMHVALDDFGTGYASLSYLRRFPFDKLKVDQAFVRNLGVINGSAAIIHSVVALGRSLGMIVHAEGVETLEHHIFLRAAGCHHFQGFYFGKPMEKAKIDAKVGAPNAGYARLDAHGLARRA